MTNARVAWVTGGSRGIGKASAIRLALDGYDVAIGCHEATEAANEVADEVRAAGRQAYVVAGDLAHPDEARTAHREVVQGLGHPNVLVVSHGIYTRNPLDELDDETWQRTLRVNVDGAFYVTRSVVPAMRGSGWGRLVYLGSILGRTGSTQGAHYGASKAALLGLMRSVAQEVASDGITANLVAPSMIDTDILADDTPEKRKEREASVPVGRIGTPEECAAAISYLVSDEASYVTGTELRLDGGFKMG